MTSRSSGLIRYTESSSQKNIYIKVIHIQLYLIYIFFIFLLFFNGSVTRETLKALKCDYCFSVKNIFCYLFGETHHTYLPCDYEQIPDYSTQLPRYFQQPSSLTARLQSVSFVVNNHVQVFYLSGGQL